MRLVLVYNADAGFLAGLMDTVHKTLSPDTYPCSLCAITYGPVTMDRRWREYLHSLPFEAAFFHRPDFRAAFPACAGLSLPMIAIERGGEPEVVLDASALQRVTSVDALIAEREDALPA